MPVRVSERPLRVLRIINGLAQGGAEESLRKLVVVTSAAGIDCLVMSFGSGGALREVIERAGAQVIEMHLSRIPSPLKLIRVFKVARAWKPDIVEGWMIHGNVAAWALRGGRPRARVIWNVRSSLALSVERPLTRLLIRLGVLLSYRVDAVVYNSAATARQHEELGYSSRRTHVIPNGFDVEALSFAPDHRAQARTLWGFPNDVKIIGHLSRWHRDKDHAALLATFALVKARRPDVLLVLAGAGLDPGNEELMAEIDSRQLRGAVVLLGVVPSPSTLYPAFDAFALTSIREGFPNVLGEALASGVPCVSTDVGGCREVVGDAAVFPVGDVVGLAGALVELLDEPTEVRARRAVAGRQRIAEMYGLASLGRRYLDLYDSVLASGGSGARNAEPQHERR